MGFAKHFAVFYVGCPSFAPCCHVVGIHFRQLVDTGSVGIVSQCTERTVGNTLFFSLFCLSFVSGSFSRFFKDADVEQFFIYFPTQYILVDIAGAPL